MTTLMWIVAGVVWAGPVKLTTSDGRALDGESWGGGERGVLLVPDEPGSRAEWGGLGSKMASGGLQVLAIDLRSKGQTLGPTDGAPLTADVDAGVAWLLAHGAKEIHVVGAKMGANVALQAAVSNAEIDDLVLLTPLLNAKGVRLSTGAAGLGDRPLLVVTSADDAVAMKAATWLDGQAAGNHRLDARPGAGAGAAMLNRVADLESTIVGWINGAFSQTTAAAGSLEGELKAGAVGDLETTGTRLEERKR
ncbi:MAG: hypothetical protein H6738_07905 [Alphaproteobacteria bacterium]|nr:hypothetical protein [Alphaproteobacteria bacterium]